MKNTRGRRKPDPARSDSRQILWIVLKLPLCIVAGLIVVLVISGIYHSASGRLRYTKEDTAMAIDLMNGAYYERDFSRLAHYLDEYDPDEIEEYDLYREAVEGNRDFILWEEFSAVAGDEDLAAEYAALVREHAASCRHSENRRLLERYAEAL